MSQQKKLEKVLDLLLSEDSERATEILHQLIVEKARTIYESIVEAEDNEEIDDSDEVGGDPEEDFTDEISSDEDDIESDELNDGEAGDSIDDEYGSEDFDDGEGDTEDRIEDLETQLADLRAEFDALMGEELQEPEHADLADEFDGEEEVGDDEFDGEEGEGEFSSEFSDGDEYQDEEEKAASMFEKKKAAKLELAKQAKKGDLKKKGTKKVAEETKFLNTVADTGQRGTAKLVGTGKGATLGAEQTRSPYTSVPARKEYGGKPSKIGSGTGGEYGKYNGETAQNKTPTDNVNIKPKSSSARADKTAKYTGGKSAGTGTNKSPLSSKP
jgi:hypothetical protein